MPNAVEHNTAKTAEKVGVTTATIKALDGVFAELVGEHREVATLIKRLNGTDDQKKRRDTWLEVSSALTAHERGELQEVYKAFEGYPALQYIVDEHAHQAHRLEALIEELNALPMRDQSWLVAFQRFEAAVKQHVEEEETEFFPRAQDAIGKDKAEELRLPYLSAKRSLLHAL